MFKKQGKERSVKSVVERNVGIKAKEFLNPIPNPYVKNLSEAVEKIKSYDGVIHVVADYDADGVTSATILKLGLEKAGYEVTIRIPRRFTEGYGLNESIIDEIDSGLLITVDNGIAAHPAIKKAKAKGLEVIVIDHHLPVMENGEMILPEADLIIDPHVYPDTYNGYCGAGLAYRLIQEILPNENLDDLLVIASIGTVCDVMELTYSNRWIVSEGLRLINEGRGTEGLKAIIKETDLKNICAKDYGFTIGPILNAPGRLEDVGATKSYLLLSLNGDSLRDKAKATVIAKGLVATNEKRKDLIKKALDELKIDDSANGLVLFNPEWSEGIIGLIAGRVCEKYHKPTIAFTMAENGLLKGSGRSIPEVHLKDTLDSIKSLMEGYGGHAGAAGLSIKLDNLDSFSKAFAEACPTVIKDNYVSYDLVLNQYEIEKAFDELERFAPYGQGNPEVKYLMDYTLSYNGNYKPMSNPNHFMINDILPSGEKIKLTGFDLNEKYVNLKKPTHFKCVGTLSKSYYKGEMSYNFEIIDIEL